MIEVTIPMLLCPMSLSKNGRTHWRTRHRDFQAQKEWVFWHVSDESPDHGHEYSGGIMDIEWRYARGRHPDDDNAITRVSAARDAFQEAGLVDDDRNIRVGRVQFTKVKSGDEEVVVTLRKEST